MPKLDPNAAKSVEEAESTGGLMEEGIYEMDLLKVHDTKDGKPLAGEAGPYWSWEFVIPEDADRYAKQHQWTITSLSEKAAFKMKEMFAAFGVSPDTDTDELLGERIRVEVGVRTIQKGSRAGEPTNVIKAVYPLEDAPAGVASAKGEAKPTSKKQF